ncbi:MAG TPA: ATP-dependent DNA helicase [Candidatus Thalassarchaeaceae archaeon]|nr:ATP-dependent DNA helicase [Candidatus Thalassarchaeaceae archaeon]
MEASARALLEGRTIIAEAPTGLGKTAAVIAASVYASRCSESVSKILFLTGRQSQHRIVVDTILSLNDRLPPEVPKVSVVDLIGRESMCGKLDMQRQCYCEEDTPHEALGSRRSRLRKWIGERPRHVEDTIRRGRAEGTCPYHCSIEAARESEIIVLDYNHVFVDSVSRSSLSSMSIDLDSSILIVDEAHNLPDRIRMGLELRLTKNMVNAARYEMEEYQEVSERDGVSDSELSRIGSSIASMRRLGDGIERWMSTEKKRLEETEADDMLVNSSELIQVLRSSLSSSLEGGEWEKGMSQLMRVLTEVRVEESGDDEDSETSCSRLFSFLDNLSRFESSEAMALVFDLLVDEGRVTSCLLDPSVVSSELISSCSGSILMSGTLHPTSMYADTLGIDRDSSIEVIYSSPFSPDRRPAIIASDVTTRYAERGNLNTKKIREHIGAVLGSAPSNVAVFTTSYGILNEILEDRGWINRSFRIKEESPEMGKSDVSKVLKSLEEGGGKNVLFGVMGGRFSEGVDYSGGILSAAICVGLPLPPPSSRQSATLEYMSQRFGREKGWRYAAGQPAVNSVLQAMGRPIRKEEDRAILVMLEKRFGERAYSRLLPDSLVTIPCADSDMTERLSKRFFTRYP